MISDQRNAAGGPGRPGTCAAHAKAGQKTKQVRRDSSTLLLYI